MSKYIHIYDYTNKLKACLAFYQLRGKATLWSEEIKTVRKIDEEHVTWKEFQKHFKDKYLTERYYDKKENEFHELRLGTLTMDEYVKRFTSLLCYVPYMQEEKAKIHHFIGSLPNFVKEKLELDYPRSMDDAMWKACIFYEQMKQKNQGPKGGVNRKGRNMIPNRQAKFANSINVQQKPLSKFPVRNQPKAAYYENRQLEGANKLVNDQQSKSPLQCWGCRESHYYKNYLHKARTKQLSKMKEASIVGEVARSMPELMLHWMIIKQNTNPPCSNVKV